MAGKLAPKQIAQDGATDKQVFTWNNAASKWEPQTPTVSLLGFGASSVGATTTTRYLWPWHEDAIAQVSPVQYRIARACTLRNLRVRHNNTAGNGNNIVYTVRKNSVATALSCTVASTATDGSDLTNTVSFAAGDLIDIQVTKAASVGTSPVNITVSLEVVA